MEFYRCDTPLEFQLEDTYRLPAESLIVVLDHAETRDGFTLGQWVSTQRSNKDKLAKERKRLLQALQGWRWDDRQIKK